jgi:hypothetical protein
VSVGLLNIQKLIMDWIGRSQLSLNINHIPGNTQQQKISEEYLSCVSASNTVGWSSELYQNFNDKPAKAKALQRISQSVSHILTRVLNIALSIFIAKWDWQICCNKSVTFKCPGFSSALELQR